VTEYVCEELVVVDGPALQFDHSDGSHVPFCLFTISLAMGARIRLAKPLIGREIAIQSNVRITSRCPCVNSFDPADISCGGDERSPANCGVNAGIVVSSTAKVTREGVEGDPKDGDIFRLSLVLMYL